MGVRAILKAGGFRGIGLAGKLFGATVTVGAEGGNAILVTVQLTDGLGKPLAAKHLVDVWLSDTTGAALSATAPSGTVVPSVAGVIVASLTAKTHLKVISDATGKFDLNITEATAKSYYVNVAVNGQVVASQVVTFV